MQRWIAVSALGVFVACTEGVDQGDPGEPVAVEAVFEGGRFVLSQPIIVTEPGVGRFLFLMNQRDPCRAGFDDSYPIEYPLLQIRYWGLPDSGELSMPAIDARRFNGPTVEPHEIYGAGDTAGDYIRVAPRTPYSDDLDLRLTFTVRADDELGTNLKPLEPPVLVEASFIAMHCPLGS